MSTSAGYHQQPDQRPSPKAYEETELPYERPPLSKNYLSRAVTFERILIRRGSFWIDKQISMLLGRRIVSVDSERRRVTTSDGGEISYGKLIWAAGGHARRLTCSGHDLAGVHTIRSRADVDQFLTELDVTNRAVVIGGGYIGLEAAAVLAKLGKRVTLLEALPRMLARVAGEPLSRFYEDEHRAHGVDVQLSAAVSCIEESDGTARGVRLASGEVIDCEIVIVGIGNIPAVEPLLVAGAEGAYGVDVDELCRTTLPDVYAVGDCAAHHNDFAAGERIRLESVQNASDQATVVAKAITGAPLPYDAVPWFWSNQYDLKLQTVGLSAGYDECIVRGDTQTRAFSIVYLRQGEVIALDCVNSMKDFVQGRHLVVSHAIISKDRLADDRLPLKELTAALAA